VSFTPSTYFYTITDVPLRSVMASVFPLFGNAFFRNLGVGPGSSMLAGISILLMLGYYVRDHIA